MTTRFAMRFVLVEVLMLILKTAAADIILENDQLKVSLSETTGQAIGLADKQGIVYLAGNADQYDLEGKISTEAKDEVVQKKVKKAVATFECFNKDLGLKIAKEYRLVDGRLEKSVRYMIEGPQKLLLKVSSESLLAPGFLAGGYYYLPTDDGSRETRSKPAPPGPLKAATA